MKNTLALISLSTLIAAVPATALAQNLLTNGNLDRTQATEIVPGFFLPKPSSWINAGSRTISGPYEDEMSSEPWAGPAPTPVTTDGLLNGPSPEGCSGPDCAVFFKPFSGNAVNGAATGHLYQDVPGSAGSLYLLTGWAGAEPNFNGGAELALEFLDAGGLELGSASLDLLAAGLLVDNGLPFDYKQYMISATAPAGTTTIRSRISMLDAMSNPLGGGQAYVVDDFSLTLVPEPSTALGMLLLGMSALAARRR